MIRTYTTAIDTTYAPVSAGVVRRVWVPLMTSVSLLRPGNRQPTFQGEIMSTNEGWRAFGARRNGRDIDLGTYTDYADAEAALLARRTGRISTITWTGPRPTPTARECSTCGHPMPATGACLRPDLHWTAASIAAEEAARRARRHTLAA